MNRIPLNNVINLIKFEIRNAKQIRSTKYEIRNLLAFLNFVLVSGFEFRI